MTVRAAGACRRGPPGDLIPTRSGGQSPLFVNRQKDDGFSKCHVPQMGTKKRNAPVNNNKKTIVHAKKTCADPGGLRPFPLVPDYDFSFVLVLFVFRKRRATVPVVYFRTKNFYLIGISLS